MYRIIGEAQDFATREILPTLETAIAALQAKDTGPVRMVLDKLRGFLAAITFDVIGFVDRILHGEETRHRRAWVQGVQGLGIDLEHVVGASDLTDEFEMVVQRNVALIRDLSADVQKRVERVVSEAVLSGTRGSTVAKLLTEQFGIVAPGFRISRQRRDHALGR